MSEIQDDWSLRQLTGQEMEACATNPNLIVQMAVAKSLVEIFSKTQKKLKARDRPGRN